MSQTTKTSDGTYTGEDPDSCPTCESCGQEMIPVLRHPGSFTKDCTCDHDSEDVEFVMEERLREFIEDFHSDE
jgi:hypothetical protein